MKFIMLLLLTLFLLACSPNDADETTSPDPIALVGENRVPADTLAAMQARGTLRCGVQEALPGFGFRRGDGLYVGFDIDFCHALAAAVFGDHNAVEFFPLTSAERFPALESGQVDVLIRNTTYTLTRDASLGFDYGPILFFDGQGFLSRRGADIYQIADLDGLRFCIQPDTTSELNLVALMASLDYDYELVYIENLGTGISALASEECDLLTSDSSGLIAQQATSDDPTTFALLDMTISEEPLGPVYRENDARWGDVLRWTIYGMIQAEQLGITSQNLADYTDSNIPQIELLLGESGQLGTLLGVPDDFLWQVISQVGNYGEVYDRNIGSDSIIALPRGRNALWTSGGLLYAPPFR